MKRTTIWLPMAALAMSALAMSAPARAQDAGGVSMTDGKLSIDIRDATLFDALDLLFRSAGNPAHQIDASAKLVPVASFVRGTGDKPGITFDTALQQMVNTYGFRRQTENGVINITPRVQLQTGFPGGGFPGGGFPGGGFPGAPGGFPGAPGGFMGAGGDPRGGFTGEGFPPNFGGTGDNTQVPTNPLDGQTFGGDQQDVPTMQTNQQITPNTGGRFPGGGGGGNNGNRRDPNQKLVYRTLRTRHITARALVTLFANSSVITTEDFLGLEDFGGGNSNGGGGGGGGFGGGGNNSFSNVNGGGASNGNNNGNRGGGGFGGF